MTYFEEEGYINALKEIYHNNSPKEGRNGNTLSTFGLHYKFNLETGFPLLTTKKMFFKGIFEELLWFLNGETNSKLLEDKKVNIWKGNSSKEFLEKTNLSYDEGECGPIYGWQWRRFNADYPKKDGGFDQLRYVIDEIKKGSRRAVLSGWNPLQLDKMALPPCHILYSFYRNGNQLSCAMFMRSNDTFLGLPYNIASTALLTTLIATALKLEPCDISISVCDAHIYEEHIEAVTEQIQRTPKTKPTIKIKQPEKDFETTTEIIDWLTNVKLEDIVIENYECYPKLTAPMIS